MRIQVVGTEKTIAAFRKLPVRMQFKHIRIALNAGGGVIRDRAKQVVLKDTRILSRSLSVKVKIPNASYNVEHWGKPEYAVIGASRRFSAAVTSTASGGKKILSTRKAIFNAAFKGQTIQRRVPSRYAHLVENPHRTRGGGSAMGYSFLDTAVRTEGAVAQSKMIRKLEQGIQQEAAALYAGS